MKFGKWTEQTRRYPCTRCQKSGWCTRSTDGNFEICRRYNDGSGITRSDKNGLEYHLYYVGARPSEPHWSKLKTYKKPPKLEDEIPQANASDLNLVYSTLLENLTLDQNHFDQLSTRGLSDAEIFENKYRSMRVSGRSKIVSVLAQQFDKNLLLKVPGFYLNEFGNLKLGGAPGLIVPIRNLDDFIVGLITRLDAPTDKMKYV